MDYNELRDNKSYYAVHYQTKISKVCLLIRPLVISLKQGNTLWNDFPRTTTPADNNQTRPADNTY